MHASTDVIGRYILPHTSPFVGKCLSQSQLSTSPFCQSRQSLDDGKFYIMMTFLHSTMEPSPETPFLGYRIHPSCGIITRVIYRNANRSLDAAALPILIQQQLGLDKPFVKLCEPRRLFFRCARKELADGSGGTQVDITAWWVVRCGMR